MRLAEPLDQATGLRQLFAAAPTFRAVGVLGPDARRNARASLALAQGLSRRGGRVLMLDEAPAPYNLGGTLGIPARHTLADVPGQRLLDSVVSAGEGLSLLAAQGGASALGRLTEQHLLDMTGDWEDAAPEWMLLNSRSPLGAADLTLTAGTRVLVLPGARTHLADAYAVLKAAHNARAGGAWWVLVDGAETDAAQKLFASLRETAARFLGIMPAFLGALPRMREGAQDGAAISVALQGALAELLAGAPCDERTSFEQHWHRMWLFSRMSAEAVMRKAQNVERSRRHG